MSHWQPDAPYLLIPVEISVREFHAKLLLSCVAAEAGFSVIFGWAEPIKKHASHLPRGIVVERSVATWKLKDFQRFRRLGNPIVAWCEEGLVTLDPDSYVKYRISEDVMQVVDRFFAWGPKQAEMIETRMPSSQSKIVVAGNVRFDLLRQPYRNLFNNKVCELKKQYGPFILINTNFGDYNNVLGREAAFERLKRKLQLDHEADADFFRSWADYSGAMYHHFVDMAAHLSGSMPGHAIVVRPHPSEDLDTWRQATASFANVRVARDGNATPWLMAADAVIHNSCTTGVETFVVGSPVISYRPITSDRFDAELSNDISRQVTTLAELEATLREVLDQSEHFARQQQTNPAARQLLSQYVVNLEGSLAAEHIVATLQKLVQQRPLRSNGRLNAMRKQLRLRSAGWLNSIWVDIVRPMIQGRTYSEYKFPKVSVQEVEAIIAELQTVSSRFKDITVQPIGLQGLFHIQQR